VYVAAMVDCCFEVSDCLMQVGCARSFGQHHELLCGMANKAVWALAVLVA
jgi:hypothetical protein